MKQFILTLPLCALFLFSGCTHFAGPTTESAALSQPAVPASDSEAPTVATSPDLTDTAPPSASASEPQAMLTDEDPEVVADETKETAPPAPSAFDQALDFCDAAQNFWETGEHEAAIQSLDQAYGLVLSASTDGATDLQQKDDLRITIAKRILEIYSSRSMGAKGKQKEIQVPMNAHVKKELDRFTGKERRFFRNSYRRSGRYRAMIVAKLKDAGLPEELSWLPLIESGFTTHAVSSARALGMWQFIPSTGVKFGLKRELLIDERSDPEKSTDAAVAYLKELHGIFGDWPTVLAAYNCGEGRVIRTIRSQNVKYLDNFWDLYNRLPLETARYVPRFLATIHIIQNMEKYGFDPEALDQPIPYETVTIERQIHLRHVASAIQSSQKTLHALNPELRYQILPDAPYTLRVPEGKSETLLAKVETIPVSRPVQTSFTYHRVRSGESLSTIARKNRVSVKRIMHANNLRKANFIRAGQVIKIPASTSRKVISRNRSIPPGGLGYTVRKGDSLWSIANRFGTTATAIKRNNRLSSNLLRIGQKLHIPGNGQQVKILNNKTVYRVKPGDSPFKIALKHNMSLQRFLRLNNLKSGSTIYPGQKVYVE